MHIGAVMNRAQLPPKVTTGSPGIPVEVNREQGQTKVGGKVTGLVDPGTSIVGPPLRETTEAERTKTLRNDRGATLAEQVRNAWGRDEQLGMLRGLSKQDQQALRHWLLKNPEPYIHHNREARLKNAAIHPAAHGPISPEKLISVFRGEPWQDPVDQNAKVPPALLYEVATVDRALWAHRIAKDPDLRKAAELSPIAFGALATVGFDHLGAGAYREVEALGWWQPASKHEALGMLGEGTAAERRKVGEVASFLQDVAGERGLALAKAMGFDGAASVYSERVRAQITDYRQFPSQADRLQLIERFGLGTLKSLTEGSSNPSTLAHLRWYTAKNAGRAAEVKRAIDLEGGAKIGQAIEQIVTTGLSGLRKSGIDLLGMLSFAEARAFAQAAQDYSRPRGPMYGLSELDDRIGAKEIAARLRSGTTPAALIEEFAESREKAAIQARSEASGRLAKADQQLGGKADLASKLALFAVLQQTHEVFVDHALPRADWKAPQTEGPTSPLYERLMTSQREILIMIGKEEAPKLVAASKDGQDALRKAVWRMMDRLEPIADPAPGWSYGGFSLADLSAVAALLPAELVEPFGRAFQAGRLPVEIAEKDLLGRTRQKGVEPFSPKHVVFRTPAAVRDLGMFGGEGISGTDRRRWEAAIEGPYVDQTGPYLVAAFSDTGAKKPSAERLPGLVTLRPAGDKAWATTDAAIQIEQQLLGPALKLAAPFR